MKNEYVFKTEIGKLQELEWYVVAECYCLWEMFLENLYNLKRQRIPTFGFEDKFPDLLKESVAEIKTYGELKKFINQII